MILLILLSVIGAGPLSPVLQEPVPQKSRSPWFVVFEEKAAQGDRVQFLRAQKKAVDAWKRMNRDIPVFAWQNDDNTLYRVVPLYSFASLDTLYLRMEQVSKGLKTGRRDVEEWMESPLTVSGTVMKWVPELSYLQETELTLQQEKPFTKWMFLYLLSGQEEEAAKALQNFRDYYVNKKLDYPWDTFRVLLGKETPVLIGMFRDQSPDALQKKGNEIWEKHGDELHVLWEEVVRYTWKIENKTGWFNQSLSNIPAVPTEEKVAGGL